MKKAMSIVIPILIVGFVLFSRFHQKSTASDTAKYQAHALVQLVSGYDENPQVFKDLVEKSHDEAFDEAYRMGGRRSRSSFDEERYFSRLGESMARHAMIQSREEIAEAISREWMIEARPVATAQVR